MMRLHPLVCAHRGCSGVAPENTMAAFEAAIAIGADFLELDVHRTADGEIVCMHDATVDRTTDGSGAIAEMTLAQLQALDAGSWKHRRYAGERVPRLVDVLEVIAPRIVVDIEIKDRGIAAPVVELIRAADALRRVTIVSFDTDDLRAAKDAAPALACGLITSGPAADSPAAIHELITAALAAGANFISCAHPKLTATLVHECRLAGLGVMAWTMDDPADLRRMIDLSVDALVSNYPERAIELLEARA